jgi:hypothetical protein
LDHINIKINYCHSSSSSSFSSIIFFFRDDELGWMDDRMDVASFWCLCSASRGSSAAPPQRSWLHPSIVDGEMDGRVDGMKKTSFHHDHNVLYIY